MSTPEAEPLSWWARPRVVSIVVDNESSILPHAHALVSALRAGGDDARLVRDPERIPDGGVAFFLGCVRITPPAVLQRSRRNLVVHESDLPQGRGFAPMTWQVLAGASTIPVVLLDATDTVDAGPVVLRDTVSLDGTELCGELRALQAAATTRLVRRFLDAPLPPQGQPQRGEASHYARRRPMHSALDPDQSIAAQFDLLRVCDNDRYPAFFTLRGRRYRLRIEPDDRHLPGLDRTKD